MYALIDLDEIRKPPREPRSIGRIPFAFYGERGLKHRQWDWSGGCAGRDGHGRGSEVHQLEA
jgi:hypothetical protein